MVMAKETVNLGAGIPRATINGLPSRRPNNFIVGVVDLKKELARAVSELNSSGLAHDSIFVLSGEEGAEAIRHRGEQAGAPGVLKWISNRLDEFAGGELDSVQRHAEAAERGSYIIGVQLPNGSAQHRDGVRNLLKRYGGYDIILVECNSISSLDA